MNPNDNNPVSPSGAMGGVTPSPVDFTNPSNLNTNVSSLSMSDSLSSAQDDLTSAGQAATTGASGVVNLGDEASITPSMQSLKPADPVPGSIGSVTSVPPAKPEPMDVSAISSNSGMSSTPATGGMDTSGNAAVVGASTPAAEQSSKPVQPYYNPFMRNTMSNAGGASASGMTGAGQTSSTNVPPALQPQTEKFSDRLKIPKEKKGNVMTLLGWLMALVFAVAAVIFAILWQQAEGKEKIVYVTQTPGQEEQDPGQNPEPVAEAKGLSCKQDLGGEGIEGVEGLIDRSREMTAKFNDGVLETIGIVNTFNFVDNAAAEGARGYFDGLNNWYSEIAGNLGIEAVETELAIDDNVVNYTVSGQRDQLMGDYIGVFMLNGNEDGSVNTGVDDIEQVYKDAGFACETAE